MWIIALVLVILQRRMIRVCVRRRISAHSTGYIAHDDSKVDTKRIGGMMMIGEEANARNGQNRDWFINSILLLFLFGPFT